jgi:glycosyltransferase involved in cell wall biosynthesis
LCALIITPLLIPVIVFFAAVAVQFIYLVVFLAALGKKDLTKTSSNQPVSVIVCAHDEETNLRELIPALLQQDYPAFEVIIVNDRSNDNTFDFLLEETKKDQRLKMVNVKSVPEHVNNKKYALTLGIRAAVNEWILLTDADCRPATNGWISSMNEQFDDKTQFVLGFSPYQHQPGFLNLFIRFDSLLTALQYLSFARVKNPYMGVGRNLSYRKSLFLEKKGFNNYLHVMGGDDDLFVNQHANSKNTRIQIKPESIVYSIPETTWKSFFYQKIRHLSVGKRYKFGHKFLLGLFLLSWVITWFVGLPVGVLYAYNYSIIGYTVIGAMLLKIILLVWNMRALSKKTGLSYKFWVIPVLDFLYPIYYISTGLVTLLTKRVRWKN